MYQLWGDLINYLIILAIGVGLIVHFYRKKKKHLLILALMMIGINLLFAIRAYQNIGLRNIENEEKTQRTTEELETAMESGDELLADSLFTYNNLITILVPKTFKLSKLEGESPGFMLTKEFHDGVFAVVGSITKNLRNKSFEDLSNEMDDVINSLETKFELTPNENLSCPTPDCKIMNFTATTQQNTKSSGIISYLFDGNYFYTITFTSNKISPIKSAEYQLDIFNSIRLENGL